MKKRLIFGLVALGFLSIVSYRITTHQNYSTDTYSSEPELKEERISVNTLYVKNVPSNQGLKKTVTINSFENSFFKTLYEVDEKIAYRERTHCIETPWILRSRLIKIDKSILALNKPIAFHLFDDINHSIVFHSVEKAYGASKNQVWYGKVERTKYSWVTLVVSENLIMGTIRVPEIGTGLYEIRYVADGVQVIREIDESKQPPSMPLVPEEKDIKKK